MKKVLATIVLSAVVALVGGTAVLAQAAPTLSVARGDKEAKLSWTSGSVNASSYTVYRATGPCPNTNLSSNIKDNHTTLSYTDTGLTNDQMYCYQVAAFPSGGGLAALSNKVSVVPGIGFSPATPDPTFGSTPNQNQLPQSVNDILKFFAGLAQWFFVGLMLIVTFLVLYGAFLFLTSQGDPEKTKQARGLLLWVAIGIIVAALAWVFPKIVQNFVGIGQ